VRNSPPFETTIKSKRKKKGKLELPFAIGQLNVAMVGNKTPSPTYTHNKTSRAKVPLLLHNEEHYNGEELHFCVLPLLETAIERKENKRS
jgi:hypothetical protein